MGATISGATISGETDSGGPGEIEALSGAEPQILRGRRLAGRVVSVLATPDPDRFLTSAVDRLDLGLEGIAGDRHAGFARASGGREPWYPRGTPMRNDRQLSLLSAEELAVVAARLGLAALPAEWIGGNVVLAEVPRLSFLPRGTRITAGPCTLRVEGQNAPCRFAGAAIAAETGRAELELDFVREARRLRGLIASVERAGPLEPGATVSIEVPEQWIYG